MIQVYQPKTSLAAKIKRRLVPFQARRILPVKLDRPIVSFTFDDCPKSVMENALGPLEKEGWLSTIYIALGLCETTNHLGLHMSRADVKAAHESGHEIGDHTFSHCDGSAIPLNEVLTDIEKNQTELASIGLPPSNTFAYPYGEATAALKKALETGFKSARGIKSNSHESTLDLNQLGSNRLYAGQDFEVLQSQIKDLKNAPAYMTIFTHDVRENPSAFGCTPAQFRETLKAVKDSGAQVVTVTEAIDYLEAQNA